MNELEQKKLSLVKALEELQKEIDYRNIDRLWDEREEFRKLINDRDRIINEIEQIKKEIKQAEQITLSI